MFTKQQLAKWRNEGFVFPEFYDEVAVDEKKKEEKFNEVKNIPLVSFKGTAPPKIEINKETLIEFVISGQSRILQNNFDVELLTSDSNIFFSTKKWSNVDYGYGLKTKVKAIKEGNYLLQFNINMKDSNALNLTFYAPEIIENCKKENEQIDDLIIISMFEFKNKFDFESFTK